MESVAVSNMNEPVRRRRRSVLILRVLWYVAAVLSVQALWFSLPMGYARLATVCTETPCPVDELTPLGLEYLQQLGLTPQIYAFYETGLFALAALIFGGVSIAIFVARPNEPMALFVAILLMLFGVFVPENVDTLYHLHPAYERFLFFMRSICWISLAWLFYLFPDGRFVPRWTRWAAYLWIVMQSVPLILGPESLAWGEVAALIELFIYLGLLVACIVAQFIRFRRASTETQRLQSKWLLFGFTQALVVVILFVEMPPFFFPAWEVTGSLPDLIISAVQVISLSFIPISIGFAIMRYRLWDIDLVINRTLVYVPLTSIVAVLYSTTMNVSQRLFTTSGGEESQAVAVVTTIVLTTTFTPIRTRIQGFVDKHFKEDVDRLKQLRELEEQVRYVVETLDRQQVGKRLVNHAVFALHAKGGALYLNRGGSRELVHVSDGWNAQDRQVSLALIDKPAAAENSPPPDAGAGANEESAATTVAAGTYLGLLLISLRVGGVEPDPKRLAEVRQTATNVVKGMVRTPSGSMHAVKPHP